MSALRSDLPLLINVTHNHSANPQPTIIQPHRNPQSFSHIASMHSAGTLHHSSATLPQSMSNDGETTPALILVNRHLASLPVPEQQQVLCSLLRAAQSLHTAITKQCTGKLCLRYSTYSIERLKAFLPWLSKHGRLLSSLALEVHLANSAFHEAETAIGAALQAASRAATAAGRGPSNAGCHGGWWYAGPAGLQLQSYCSHPAITGAVLDQLDR